jgi:predicted small metal-binding protein
MKRLTCKDLGGPCEFEILGDSFEEIGKKSYGHVMEQIDGGDELHKAAAAKMKNASPEEQQAMMAAFRKKFEDAPDMDM